MRVYRMDVTLQDSLHLSDTLWIRPVHIFALYVTRLWLAPR